MWLIDCKPIISCRPVFNHWAGVPPSSHPVPSRVLVTPGVCTGKFVYGAILREFKGHQSCRAKRCWRMFLVVYGVILRELVPSSCLNQPTRKIAPCKSRVYLGRFYVFLYSRKTCPRVTRVFFPRKMLPRGNYSRWKLRKITPRVTGGFSSILRKNLYDRPIWVSICAKSTAHRSVVQNSTYNSLICHVLHMGNV